MKYDGFNAKKQPGFPNNDSDNSYEAEQEEAPATIERPKPIVMDFNDEQGNTIRDKKMKKFEEFKQRREMQDK